MARNVKRGLGTSTEFRAHVRDVKQFLEISPGREKAPGARKAREKQKNQRKRARRPARPPVAKVRTCVAEGTGNEVPGPGTLTSAWPARKDWAQSPPPVSPTKRMALSLPRRRRRWAERASAWVVNFARGRSRSSSGPVASRLAQVEQEAIFRYRMHAGSLLRKDRPGFRARAKGFPMGCRLVARAAGGWHGRAREPRRSRATPCPASAASSVRRWSAAVAAAPSRRNRRTPPAARPSASTRMSASIQRRRSSGFRIPSQWLHKRKVMVSPWCKRATPVNAESAAKRATFRPDERLRIPDWQSRSRSRHANIVRSAGSPGFS